MAALNSQFTEQIPVSPPEPSGGMRLDEVSNHSLEYGSPEKIGKKLHGLLFRAPFYAEVCLEGESLFLFCHLPVLLSDA